MLRWRKLPIREPNEFIRWSMSVIILSLMSLNSQHTPIYARISLVKKYLEHQ